MQKIETLPLRDALLKQALILAYITIGYNIAEGLISVWLGLEDETIALVGFGFDSFVEVISGLGILHMTIRMRRGGAECPDRFEAQALRVTGWAFYFLTAGLVFTSAINIYTGHRPETTLWGVVVSIVSIFTMWLLIRHKVRVGKALGSDAILADAACTRTCMRLSVILFASSITYELTGIGVVDSVGAIGIAYLSFLEGREALEKADGKECSCHKA